MLEFICYFNGSKLWYEFKDIFSKKKGNCCKTYNQCGYCDFKH